MMHFGLQAASAQNVWMMHFGVQAASATCDATPAWGFVASGGMAQSKRRRRSLQRLRVAMEQESHRFGKFAH